MAPSGCSTSGPVEPREGALGKTGAFPCPPPSAVGAREVTLSFWGGKGIAHSQSGKRRLEI